MNTKNTATNRITTDTPNRTNARSRGHVTAIPDDLDPIVRRAASGDREAIAWMARHLRPLLLDEARRILRPLDAESEAEDVVQDVFVFLLSGKARGMPRQGSALGWVCHVLEYLAKPRGYWSADDPEDPPDEEVAPEDPPEEDEVT